MKRILALVLCLLMLVCTFASCGSKDEEDKGAIIQMYLSSDITNFDPAYSYTDDAMTKVFGLLYQGLFELDEDGKVQKALCKDYEIIEDEEADLYKMHITLNKTAWSDGRQVSSDDVIYAWKRALAPEFSSPAASMLFDIKNAQAYKSGNASPDDVGLYPIDTDDFEIIFEGKINYDLFLENMCSPVLVPLREDIIAKAPDGWATNVAIMVFNGPFAVRAHIPGEKLLLQRNGYFYRDAKDKDDKVVTPYRLYIDLSYTPDDQLASYQEGEVFYDGDIPVEYRADFQKKIKTVDMQNVHTYYFNTNNELFKKAEVRQALSMALDRQEMADLLVYATPATGLITKGVFDTSRKNSFRTKGGDLLETAANADEAKALLKKAGVSGGAFEIAIRDNDVDKTLANYAKDVWSKLGFNVTVKTYTYSKYTTPNEYECLKDEFQDIFYNGTFDVAGIDLQMLSTDAFSTLSQFAVGYSGSCPDFTTKDWDLMPGVTGWNNSEYNELIDKAYKAESDRTERTGYLHSAEEILMNELPVCPVVVLQNGYLSSKKLSGIKFDYYGCPIFEKTSQKSYHKYTNVGKDEEKDK